MPFEGAFAEPSSNRGPGNDTGVRYDTGRWLIDLNHWYEGLPDTRRVFVYPAVLVAAGFVNTRLTGAPIGWVSVSALAALIAVRRSYVSGWLAARVPAGGQVADTRPRAVAAPVPPAPAAIAKPEPVRPAVVAPAAAPEIRVPAPAAVASASVQPIARAVPEPPVQPAPAPKPVVRVVGSDRHTARARTGQPRERGPPRQRRQARERSPRPQARGEVRQAQAWRQASVARPERNTRIDAAGGLDGFLPARRRVSAQFRVILDARVRA